MEIKKTGGEAYALVYVILNHGESVIAENGAMVAMSAGIEITVAAEGGIGKSIGRKIFADEGFFFTRFTAHAGGAWVALAPKFPGDVFTTLSTSEGLTIQTGSILGHGEEVNTKVIYAGVKSALMKEGLTAIQASGEGYILLSTYGAVEEITLVAGQELNIDSGHLVAWSPSLKLDLILAGGLINQAFSGEGIVAKFTATDNDGKIIIQTRSEQQLFQWLTPKRNENSGG